MKIFLDNLEFPEALRWHNDQLWFSDMNGGGVFSADESGKCTPIVDVPGNPSGLGWLPDGRLLIVSMHNRCLYRFDADGLVQVADLASLVPASCNDMVVDAMGRAFIGNFGFDLRGGKKPQSTMVVRVDPDGTTLVVAQDLMFPNGSVITADGETLLIAETFAERITAFTIDRHGLLHDRRSWAELPGKTPDGIALDKEGCLWIASPHSNEVLRVEEGGKITDTLLSDRMPFACALGGEDIASLFIATSRRGLSPQESRAGRYGAILRHRL